MKKPEHTFFSLLHAHELKIISFLQSFRSFGGDCFFFFFNSFDYALTYILVILLVGRSLSLKAAIELSYLLAVTILAGSGLKQLFAQPRPYDIMPSLKIIGTHDYGMPSKAAAGIVVTVGFIFFLQTASNTLLKLAGLGVILLVGLTRVYVGAHFPSDILGGYALGTIILML